MLTAECNFCNHDEFEKITGTLLVLFKAYHRRDFKHARIFLAAVRPRFEYFFSVPTHTIGVHIHH